MGSTHTKERHLHIYKSGNKVIYKIKGDKFEKNTPPICIIDKDQLVPLKSVCFIYPFKI